MRFLLFNMLVMCFNCTEKFYDKILNNANDRHGYFISLTIKDNQSQRMVVVSNTDLYDAMSKTKGFKADQYSSVLKNALRNNLVVSLAPNIASESKGFYEVKSCAEVERIAREGKDHFIDYYFKTGVLRKPIINPETHCIIKKLFEWCIPSKIDDESGFLIIDDH